MGVLDKIPFTEKYKEKKEEKKNNKKLGIEKYKEKESKYEEEKKEIGFERNEERRHQKYKELDEKYPDVVDIKNKRANTRIAIVALLITSLGYATYLNGDEKEEPQKIDQEKISNEEIQELINRLEEFKGKNTSEITKYKGFENILRIAFKNQANNNPDWTNDMIRQINNQIERNGGEIPRGKDGKINKWKIHSKTLDYIIGKLTKQIEVNNKIKEEIERRKRERERETF